MGFVSCWLFFLYDEFEYTNYILRIHGLHLVKTKVRTSIFEIQPTALSQSKNLALHWIELNWTTTWSIKILIVLFDDSLLYIFFLLRLLALKYSPSQPFGLDMCSVSGGGEECINCLMWYYISCNCTLSERDTNCYYKTSVENWVFLFSYCLC